MIGSKIAHYEIGRKLGSGGMGDVFAARDTKLGREVALKVLPPDVAGDAERRQRFEREACAAAALNHPNIVTIHSVEEEDGECFLTMELVEGTPLADRIPSQGMPVEELLRVAASLTDAVATAHEAGIIHRDLKPANVMITTDGVVKVLDFGLAKLAPIREALAENMATVTAGAITTGEGRVLGTPAYMSPEQAEGKKLDARTDVFSLGVVFYEMAVGKRPFGGDSTMSTISSVLRDTPPPIVELRGDLPPRLSRIIGRCLVKDRKRRYQTARDLATDLEELHQGGALEATSTAGVAMADHAVVTPSRSASKALLVSMVAAALGFGVAIGFFASPRFAQGNADDNGSSSASASATAGPPVKHFQRMTVDYGPELDPRISPDGQWFVYSANTDHDVTNGDIYRQRVGGRNRTNLTPESKKDDWQPAISHDGERIAFRSERDGGGIYVMGATGESARRVTDFGYHPAWSPDGKKLVVGSQLVANPMARGAESEAWIVDVEGGNKTRLDTGGDAVPGSWSPDGRQLVFFCMRSGGRVGPYAIPTEGGEARTLFNGPTGRGWGPFWTADGRYVYYASVATGVANIWRLQMEKGTPRGSPEPVTAGVAGWADTPTVSRDGKRLLFRVSTTASNVAKVAFDAAQGRIVGEPIMLTRGLNGYCYVDVSPDGAWLALAECKALLPDVEENVYVARVDGSERRALTLDKGKVNRLPRWTADGKHILFYSDRSGDYEAWSVAPDGSGLRRLTDTPGKSLLFTLPSPKGTRAVSWINMEGMIEFDTEKPLTDPSVKRVAPYSKGGGQFVPTDWSPDGMQVAGYLDPTGAVLIYTFDTGEYDTITEGGGGPIWLRDGKRLVYAGVGGLHIVNVKERKPRLMFTSKLGSIVDFTVSNDERFLYLLLVTQDDDIWLADLE